MANMNLGGIRLQKARALGKLMGKGAAGKPVTELAPVRGGANAMKNHERGAASFEPGCSATGYPRAKSHPDKTGV